MNLISCDKCGTVFDAKKLNFPEDIYINEKGDAYGCVDLSKGTWDSDRDRFVPFVKCFHCNEKILEP